MSLIHLHTEEAGMAKEKQPTEPVEMYSDGVFANTVPAPPPTWTATERDPDTGEMKKQKEAGDEPTE
jgi:hypothetical protein